MKLMRGQANDIIGITPPQALDAVTEQGRSPAPGVVLEYQDLEDNALGRRGRMGRGAELLLQAVGMAATAARLLQRQSGLHPDQGAPGPGLH